MNKNRWYQRYPFYGFLVALIILPCVSRAQSSRNEAKLQILRDKVQRAENKVAVAERKLAIADSLITYGEQSIAGAEEEFSRIEDEQKQLEKDYRSKYKELKKLTKSKDGETAAQAERDLKALDAQFKADIKTYSDEIKRLTRQAARGEKDIGKGIDLQKTANRSLKEARKALELAGKNYEEALSSMN